MEGTGREAEDTSENGRKWRPRLQKLSANPPDCDLGREMGTETQEANRTLFPNCVTLPSYHLFSGHL